MIFKKCIIDILITVHIKKKKTLLFRTALHDVVVYHVTIVAFGHGLLKKFWPF